MLKRSSWPFSETSSVLASGHEDGFSFELFIQPFQWPSVVLFSSLLFKRPRFQPVGFRSWAEAHSLTAARLLGRRAPLLLLERPSFREDVQPGGVARPPAPVPALRTPGPAPPSSSRSLSHLRQLPAPCFPTCSLQGHSFCGSTLLTR